jgi:3-mercaptopropionate dioxygenase
MCNFTNESADAPFGYIVDAPEVRAIIAGAERVIAELPDTDNAARIAALEPAFRQLLAAEGWLPDELAAPDETSGMGGGIGQYALYRAEDGSLCLFTLVVPAGSATPVHDHLAWGLVGLYRGRQAETVYRRLDDGAEDGRATLEVAARQQLEPGGLYPLLPPDGDIHRVTTISESASVSIHLLANDTACVWRHQFDPDAGSVKAFRSGYSNAACRPAPA